MNTNAAATYNLPTTSLRGIRPKTCVAGLYCRLSKEDGENSVSISIENQRAMLQLYAKENGLQVFKVYEDDGYSGGNYNRPAFKYLIRDIENGFINCVIVKDLSRLGREHIETGRYIEQYFPEHFVRFISIGENYDSEIDNNNDMVPFYNVFNEMHIRETSKKTRNAYTLMSKQGKFSGSQAAYGYRKDPLDKHHLIVDEQTVGIVQRIFNMASKGCGYDMIANTLRREKILTPTAYNLEQGLGNKSGQYNGDPYNWSSFSLRKILANPVYLGHMVNRKSTTLSHKCKRIIKLPPEEWIIVENTHEPIVSNEFWDDTQNMLKKRKNKCANTGEPQIFAKLLKCDECGATLTYYANKREFNCSTYRIKGKDMCRSHYIKYDAIYHILLEDIRKHAKMVMRDEKKLYSNLLADTQTARRKKADGLKKELDKLQVRIAEIDLYTRKLYEDNVKGKVPDEQFSVLMRGYSRDRTDLQEKQAQSQKTIDTYVGEEQSVEEFLFRIKKYAEIEELTMEILNQLIERVEISPIYHEDKKKKQDIVIYYRFVGRIE